LGNDSTKAVQNWSLVCMLQPSIHRRKTNLQACKACWRPASGAAQKF